MGLLQRTSSSFPICSRAPINPEIRHGVAVFKRVLEERRGEPLPECFLQFFEKEELWWGIGQQLFIHAISFCAKSDVLTQWRGYCPDGGVAIGVNFSELLRRAYASEVLLWKMLYEADAQRELAQRMLAIGNRNLEELNRLLVNVPETESKKAYNEYVKLVSNMFFMSALTFKHDAFDSEEEWRVILLDTSGGISERLKFRARGKTITPYVELVFEPASMISEIQCSPGTWSRSALYSIDRLAKKMGNVKVTHSRLPL